MWHDRHAPRSEEDLAAVLHRKKVIDVREWLEQQRRALMQLAGGAAPTGHCGGGGGGAAGPRGAGPSSSRPAPQHSAEHGSQRQHQQQQRPLAPGGAAGCGAARPRPCGVAVLTGPAGCGKSACVRVLADAVGFDIVEWTPPPPVLWSEHQYQLLLLEDLPHTHDPERRQRLAASLRDLVACARGPVVLIATEVEGPAAGGGGPGGRGGAGDAGSMGGVKGLHKDILAVLNAAGALTISFNAITANNIAKLLLRVAAAEGLQLSPAAAVGLAEAADGDVRAALQALQMDAALLRAATRGAEAAEDRRGAGGGKAGKGGKKAGAGKGKGGKAAPSEMAMLRAGRQQALSAGEVARLAAAQRDLGLPLFHALGKFLYNKRAPLPGPGGGGGAGNSDSEDGEEAGKAAAAGRRGGGAKAGGKDKDSVALQQLNAHALRAGRAWTVGAGIGAQLPERLQRRPMRYDPEAIIQRCGLEAPRLLAFLHENYPPFVDPEADDAVDDVAVIAAYLSDSAVLCGLSRAAAAATAFGGTSLWMEDSPSASNLASAIAASVAGRGLMFGNTHPAPPRFNPIRAPAISSIDQAATANRAQLRSTMCRLAEAPAAGAAPSAGMAVGALGGSSQELVGDVMPWMRALAQSSQQHAAWLVRVLPGSWSYYWNGAVTEGAFLPRVAAPPPQQQQQQAAGGWGVAGVASGLEGLEIEDADPIED
ncbi:hypothetical protein GPECTOR_70g470 [Gonium pectorale]|uniref:AAA+ ATPase domain-containing protein n=1 Tax=Gonium pectorale TaxID=33097 RepID=A0A150G4K8_GONPE|nr:hypothetical protein GPECTOR_70g470 [Gonium pectorale]|eukprot:KXZ44240.1 hypothetical protein GPECTOR_70g470 [Gonium pectorale]